MCKRIQRKRIKGWRKPSNTIYVGRGSKWGNPFMHGKNENNEDEICIKIHDDDGWTLFMMGDFNSMLDTYERLIKGEKDRLFNEDYTYWFKKFQQLNPSELWGKDLMCWCALDEKCHADILLRLANG